MLGIRRRWSCRAWIWRTRGSSGCAGMVGSGLHRPLQLCHCPHRCLPSWRRRPGRSVRHYGRNRSPVGSRLGMEQDTKIQRAGCARL